MSHIPPDHSITDLGTDLELRRAVRRTIEWAIGETIQCGSRERSGPVPVIGSPEWFRADHLTRVASILLLGEQYLIDDPDREIDRRLRSLMWDLLGPCDGCTRNRCRALKDGREPCGVPSWAAAARHPSHTELGQRRAEPGPLAHEVDPEAVRRWVATGHSDRKGTAA